MLRTRSVSAGVLIAAAALLICVSAASTAVASQAPTVARAPAPALAAAPTATAPRPGFLAPAGAFVDEAFSGDSCVDASGWSSTPYWCLAVGFYANVNGEIPVGLGWNQGGVSRWDGYYPTDIPDKVNLPNATSCSAEGGLPTCAVVGDYYRNPRYETQFAEAPADGSALGIVAEKNPPGSTWSALADVSCPASTFCLMVGEAGTSSKTGHKIVYTSHATAYSWTGGGTLTRLSPPAPAGARTSELAGVSCASATTCLAVGNYTSAHGKWLTYSVAWNSGTWTLQPALSVPGQARTTFQDVACPSATLCMAVGDSTGPGSHPFAQEWNDGSWQISPTPAANGAAMFGVTCPTVSFCYGSGSRGDHGLIEAWNGTSWSAQSSPATGAPFSGDVLAHVSCLTTTQCLAVGYRFDPGIKPSRRTFRYLAEVLTGSGWQVHNP